MSYFSNTISASSLERVCIYKSRRRYLLRRIPYASHESFNPYVISNKEARIINGNIFIGKVIK